MTPIEELSVAVHYAPGDREVRNVGRDRVLTIGLVQPAGRAGRYFL